MNSFNRILLYAVAAITLAACSSTKDVSDMEGDLFGKIYYRNKVFQKSPKDSRTSEKVRLSHKSGRAGLYEEPRFHLVGRYASDADYVHRKFEDLLSTFQQSHFFNLQKPDGAKEADMTRNTSAEGVIKPYAERNSVDWSTGRVAVIGGLSVVFLSLLILVIMRGVQKGFLLAGLIFVSLLLFLGIIYMIFSASDITSILV